MTNILQQIAIQLDAYSNLEALKAAFKEWISTSDGNLDALKKALEAHVEGNYELSDDDLQKLQEQDLIFSNDDATKEEDMRRLQRYKDTGYGISHEQVAAWLASVGTDHEPPCPK
jgi:hypothetical protein